MSAKAWHSCDVDIDTGWYPAQTKLEEEQEPDPEALLPVDGVTKQHSLTRLGVTAGISGNSASVPTVLTKLQKWGDYVSVGALVLPTKFIPMKTPLSAEILDTWSLPSQPKHRLTVPEMVAQQAALGRKVGLLLDLSNHDCLYTADIPPGLTYMHVQLVAKELPPPEFVDTVVAVANKFWAQHPEEYIAVHCAYGFNRTGFVVCCYLIECCGFSVEDALAAFAESRPPGVKHEQFRNELHRRYSNGMHGSNVYSSPDDNSSFGCSPSCGSLDLRDLCSSGSGASPVPGLTRGATFDCLLGHHHSAVAAGNGGADSSPGAYRHSIDGHQTLTFTTSFAAEFRRNSSGGGTKPAAAQAHPLRSQLPPLAPPQSQAQTQAHAQLHREQQSHGRHTSLHLEQSPRDERWSQLVDGRPQANGSGNGSGQYGSNFAATRKDCGFEAKLGPAVSAPPSRTSATGAVDSRGGACGGGDAGSSRAGSQCQLQSCYSMDNESLGVDDRAILQSLRQQAIEIVSASMISEEPGSTNSTPARGCSSISLADCDSTRGHSSPRPAHLGKYSHKNLDAIDWSAAGAEDEGARVIGRGTDSPLPAFESLRLG